MSYVKGTVSFTKGTRMSIYIEYYGSMSCTNGIVSCTNRTVSCTKGTAVNIDRTSWLSIL